jgi:Aminotransferase class-V
LRTPAGLLAGASPREIIFTSGATEANNMAVKGVAGFYKERKRHVITVQTEHKCVLDSCRVLQQHGFDVTYLKARFWIRCHCCARVPVSGALCKAVPAAPVQTMLAYTVRRHEVAVPGNALQGWAATRQLRSKKVRMLAG